MNFARRISFAPKDYAAAFHKWNDSYYRRYFHARAREGTIKPLVHFLLIACSGSYFVEWYCKGRHHVAHKKHDIEEGLKLLEEKRAAGGGGHGHH